MSRFPSSRESAAFPFSSAFDDLVEQQDFMSRRPAEVKPPPGFQGPPVSARQASPTHYLLVGVSPTQANMQTLTSLARGEGVELMEALPLHVWSHVVLVFFDLRHALKVKNALSSLWHENGMLQCHFAVPTPLGLVDLAPSRLVLDGLPAMFDPTILQNTLSNFGDLKTLAKVDPAGSSYVVEFYDSRDCSFAAQNLNGRFFHGHFIRAAIWNLEADLGSILQSIRKEPDLPKTQSKPTRFDAHRLGALEFQVQQGASSAKHLLRPAQQQPSKPATYSAALLTPRQQQLRDEAAAENDAKSVATSSSLANTGAQDACNQIDLISILEGRDKRTTFMIRNIPNKYTQEMLMELIDESHKGQYDFLYLRMDFKNRCNVGYAFINFIDPQSAVSFALKVCGKRWSKFNSEKICSLSYANIQGKDALISKFRDSQVMLEQANYRPKIFYSDGPLKGQEEPFPAPTPSGLRRLSGRSGSSGRQSATSVGDPGSGTIGQPSMLLSEFSESSHLYRPSSN